MEKHDGEIIDADEKRSAERTAAIVNRVRNALREHQALFGSFTGDDLIKTVAANTVSREEAALVAIFVNEGIKPSGRELTLSFKVI
jgi:hypothetical protein